MSIPTETIEMLDYDWLRAVIRAVRLADYSDAHVVDLDGVRPAATHLEELLLRGALADFCLRQQQRSGFAARTQRPAGLLGAIQQAACFEGCTPARIAADRRISVATLQRRCKALTGHSVMDYVHRVRVSIAREEILGTILSVKEVAAKVGYSNASVMNRHFRRIYGVRPSDFRDHQ